MAFEDETITVTMEPERFGIIGHVSRGGGKSALAAMALQAMVAAGGISIGGVQVIEMPPEATPSSEPAIIGRPHKDRAAEKARRDARRRRNGRFVWP